MMKKGNAAKYYIPFRVKISFLSTIMLCLSLGGYLFFAIDLFTEDKEAYIHESGTFIVESYSSQLVNEINNVTIKSVALLNIDKDFISDDSLLSEEIKIIFEIKNDASLELLFSSKERYSPQEFARFVPSDGLIKFFLYDEQQFGLLKLPSSSASIYTIFNASKIRSLFTAGTSLYRTDLIDIESKMSVFEEKTLDSIARPSRSIASVDENALSLGIKTINLEISSQPFIATFKRIPMFNHAVMATISTETAYSGKDFMIKKSILIGIFFILLGITLSIYTSRKVTTPINYLVNETQSFSNGNLDRKIKTSWGSEFGQLASAFDSMRLNIIVLLKEAKNKTRMEKDLETASAVQNTLFSVNSFNDDCIDFVGHYKSASECGGDWFSHKKVSSCYYFWGADATGHGVAAAILTTALSSAIRLIETLNINTTDLPNITNSLNYIIRSMSKRRMFLTFFSARYESQTRLLTYVNHAHNPPVIFRNTGRGYEIIHLEPTSNQRMGEKIVHLKDSTIDEITRGSFLFFYTDGLIEAKNDADIALGEKRLLKKILKYLKSEKGTISSKMIHDFLMSDLAEYFVDIEDDITFFITEFK